VVKALSSIPSAVKEEQEDAKALLRVVYRVFSFVCLDYSI
jgi:hypothetical protein